MKRTPLYAAHQQLGGKLIEFGGWEMPVQYTSITDEHLAVRQAAGLFDISHMGEVLISGADAEAFLNHTLTNDLRKPADDCRRAVAVLRVARQGVQVGKEPSVVLRPTPAAPPRVRLEEVLMPLRVLVPAVNLLRAAWRRDDQLAVVGEGDALLVVRGKLEKDLALTGYLADRLAESREGLLRLQRARRSDAPRVEAVYEVAREMLGGAADDRMSRPGASATLRGELALALNQYNRRSGGALLVAAADLLGSTSVNLIADSFPKGFFNAEGNPGSRTLSLGGICEDGATGILSGISTFGHHIGVIASYGAFLAPLAHITARLHAIGNQARHNVFGDAFKPMIVICAHAGLTTGEDGPTHADPQALQLLQDNFPRGTVVTLTPWDPREIWTLVAAELAKRPAVIAPFHAPRGDRSGPRSARPLPLLCSRPISIGFIINNKTINSL